MAKRLLEGDQLEKRARELGVDIKGGPIFQSSSGRVQRVEDYELQRRVMEVERQQREKWLWFLAGISAPASLASAIAAWAAVAHR